MANSVSSENSQNLFSKFLGTVGLFAAALFFTGWIYRWAYYDYFQLDITSLSFPAESFLIVPIQVFLGSPTLILQTIALFFVAVILIYTVLWLTRSLEQPLEDRVEAADYHLQFAARPQRSPLGKLLQVLRRNNPIQPRSFRLLESFFHELLIIALILVFLFFYARHRGSTDAMRDANHCTSTLPIVTVVMSKAKLPYMRPFSEPLENTPPLSATLKDFGVVGDTNLLKNMWEFAINDPLVESPTTIWRLLQEGDGWIYLFTDLSIEQVQKQLHPVVLGIRTSFGEQVMLLKPAPKATSKEQCQ